MRLALRSARIQNFKAIRDSGTVRFTPLTAFIGNNGSGKSSLLEGLETLQTIVRDDLDEGLSRWRGLEYIWNLGVERPMHTPPGGQPCAKNPLRFTVEGTVWEGFGENRRPRQYRGESEITAGPSGDKVFFLREKLTQKSGATYRRVVIRSPSGEATDTTEGFPSQRVLPRLKPEKSLLSAEPSIDLWQFVRLNPDAMMMPRPLRRTAGHLALATDGANIAEYLLDIYQRDRRVLDGIIETMRAVLPYAVDIQPAITSELERAAYLQLTEANFKIPGWLLSTGTLRVLALLALFRHPTPPPLIVIEEIENGLDPRTIHLIMDEIRDVVQNGITQVIFTTHSPYLLDLIPLSYIVLVERSEGQPVFFRPSDDDALTRWNHEFATGQLYTMGRLRRSLK